MKKYEKVAIIGGGNIGKAIARGLGKSIRFTSDRITVTRRKAHLLEELKGEGFVITRDNLEAIKNSDIVIIAVLPQQITALLKEIKDELNPDRHLLISVVSGVSSDEIRKLVGKEMSIIRAMPNTAIAVGESMTCIASNHAAPEDFETAKEIFDSTGTTLKIDEKQMTSATALCACGVAFFLRAIRAASQGGIEIGFHPHEAIPMAAQTALGAAALLLEMKTHPEKEIDKVTTPRGCTISGLNEMEHKGFSSAMIRGIIVSAEKADLLYSGNNECK